MLWQPRTVDQVTMFADRRTKESPAIKIWMQLTQALDIVPVKDGISRKLDWWKTKSKIKAYQRSLVLKLILNPSDGFGA